MITFEYCRACGHELKPGTAGRGIGVCTNCMYKQNDKKVLSIPIPRYSNREEKRDGD